MKRSITRSVLADEKGRLLQRSFQLGPKDPPWRNLTKEEDDLTMASPSAFLYPQNGDPLIPLRLVEIVVSTDRFIADGKEEAAVQVKGDIDGTVGIRINNDHYDMDSSDTVLISTASPGLYQVMLDDDRYWAVRPSYIIVAVATAGSENG